MTLPFFGLVVCLDVASNALEGYWSKELRWLIERISVDDGPGMLAHAIN